MLNCRHTDSKSPGASNPHHRLRRRERRWYRHLQPHRLRRSVRAAGKRRVLDTSFARHRLAVRNEYDALIIRVVSHFFPSSTNPLARECLLICRWRIFDKSNSDNAQIRRKTCSRIRFSRARHRYAKERCRPFQSLDNERGTGCAYRRTSRKSYSFNPWSVIAPMSSARAAAATSTSPDTTDPNQPTPAAHVSGDPHRKHPHSSYNP